MTWSWSSAGKLDLGPIRGHGYKDKTIACGTTANHVMPIEPCNSAEAAS